MRITLEQAKELVFYKKNLQTELCPLLESIGRRLAEPVYGTMSQPPFRRSAMDGYAVCRKDIETGISYPVIGEIDAGDLKEYILGPGETIRIMTGARCPEKADLVIPQEMSDYGEQTVRFHKLPERDNICPVGEDFANGELLLEEGLRMDANAIACAAATGRQQVKVYLRPKVAVISTGTELHELGEPLREGQIYDVNQPYLVTRLKELGCEVCRTTRVADQTETITTAIEHAINEETCNMIITTGGVSVGKKDLMEDALLKLGGELAFHGIDIKPGMPTMFGVVAGTPVLCLSGNPFAAACLFELLNPFQSLLCTAATLREPVEKSRPCRRMVHGYFDGMHVTLAKNRKNGVTTSGVKSNCLAELPAGEEPLRAGEEITVYLL